MYKNLKDENVIVELENLVKNCNIEEDLNTTYAIFMKERTGLPVEKYSNISPKFFH